VNKARHEAGHEKAPVQEKERRERQENPLVQEKNAGIT
jgi:hypothetical protein